MPTAFEIQVPRPLTSRCSFWSKVGGSHRATVEKPVVAAAPLLGRARGNRGIRLGLEHHTQAVFGALRLGRIRCQAGGLGGDTVGSPAGTARFRPGNLGPCLVFAERTPEAVFSDTRGNDGLVLDVAAAEVGRVGAGPTDGSVRALQDGVLRLPEGEGAPGYGIHAVDTNRQQQGGQSSDGRSCMNNERWARTTNMVCWIFAKLVLYPSFYC